MRLALISDPHFDHIRDRAIRGDFKRAIRAANVDAIVMTGDIAEAGTLYNAVRNVEDTNDAGDLMRVFYVLGNHDLYGASIAETHRTARSTYHLAKWIGAPDVLADHIDATTCLVGVDGWYDFRVGRCENTRIAMNDWYKIHDFMPLSAGAIVAASRALAEQSAELATRKLQAAVQAGYTRILLATHVPPFLECATHEGQVSDPDWAPIMTNIALGDALYAFATENPDVHVDVLCGHTHDRCDRMVAPNLRVRVGRAEYGRAFFEVIE